MNRTGLHATNVDGSPTQGGGFEDLAGEVGNLNPTD